MGVGTLVHCGAVVSWSVSRVSVLLLLSGVVRDRCAGMFEGVSVCCGGVVGLGVVVVSCVTVGVVLWCDSVFCSRGVIVEGCGVVVVVV